MENKKEIKDARLEYMTDVENDRNKLIKQFDDIISDIKTKTTEPPKKIGWLKRLFYILTGK